MLTFVIEESRTARLRTSGENLFVVLLIMAPFSQELEPPAIPGRYRPTNGAVPSDKSGTAPALASTVPAMQSGPDGLLQLVTQARPPIQIQFNATHPCE